MRFARGDRCGRPDKVDPDQGRSHGSMGLISVTCCQRLCYIVCDAYRSPIGSCFLNWMLFDGLGHSRSNCSVRPWPRIPDAFALDGDRAADERPLHLHRDCGERVVDETPGVGAMWSFRQPCKGVCGWRAPFGWPVQGWVQPPRSWVNGDTDEEGTYRLGKDAHAIGTVRARQGQRAAFTGPESGGANARTGSARIVRWLPCG